jgi:ERCC4-type nuclease
MLELIIDNREIVLYNIIKLWSIDNIIISQKQLELGDILILKDETKLLFERKTNNDLIASIKDGRFREQKARMLSSEYKISYIFEKLYILEENSMSEGAILNTIFRDNINVLFTKNTEDTAKLIKSLCIRLIKKPECFITKKNNYIDCIKTKSKKIENIDIKTCLILQLCQIPFISTKIAEKIAEKHKSINDLLKKINKEDSYEKKIEYLETFEKIGRKKAENILLYLMNGEDEE